MNKIIIEVDYIRNPTVKFTPAQLRRKIVDSVYERLTGERGQQAGLSVERVKFVGLEKLKDDERFF